MRSHAGKMVRVGVTVGRGANSEFHSIEAFCGENLYDVIRRKLCLETRECRLGEWITEVNGEKVHLREDMQGGLQLYVINGKNEGLPYVNHDNGEFFLSIQQMVVTGDIKVRLAYDPYTVDLPKLAGDGPIVSCVSCNVDMDDSLRKNAEMKYSIDQVKLMTPEIAMLSYAASAQGNADYNFDNSGDGAALAPHIKSAWNAGNAGWETCTGLSKSCAEFDGSRYQCILAQRGAYHVPAYAPHAFAGDLSLIHISEPTRPY